MDISHYHATPSVNTLPATTILASSFRGNHLLPSWRTTYCYQCTQSATIRIRVQLSWYTATTILASRYRGNHSLPSLYTTCHYTTYRDHTAGSYHGNHLPPSLWTTHCYHCTPSATISITVLLIMTHHLPLHCLLLPYLPAAIMVTIYCYHGGPPTVIIVHHLPL